MKNGIRSIVRGALMGVGAQQLIAIIVSARLRLGYYMACIVTLPEALGGEIRAVAYQSGVSALAGAGVALALHLWRRQWSLRKRALSAGAALMIGLLPAATMCVRAFHGL